MAACVGTAGRLLLFPVNNEDVVPWRLGGAWVLVVLVILIVPKLPMPFGRIPAEVVMIGLAPAVIAVGSRNVAGTGSDRGNGQPAREHIA